MSITRTERYDVVIIGAGQAGLAAGYWLAQHDIDFLILDAHSRIGDSWRNRWDSLRLFTPARHSALPGLPMAGDPYHLPTKDEMADYLEWYARVFDLPVRGGVRVSNLRKRDCLFEIATDGVRLEAENVIVATGPFHSPRVPAYASELNPGIVQLHSSGYRNPGQLPDGDVLVVGAANSGAQIALEISQERRVVLAGRSVGSLPRRILGRDLFDWLGATVMRAGADTLLGRRIRASVLSSTDKLIGMSESDLTTPTLRRAARVVGVKNGMPRLDSGEVLEVGSVVWCTGYRPDFRWIDAPVFAEDGFPVHTRGLTSVAGLYFLGLRFQHRLNSSLVGGVGRDAKFVARAVVGRYGSTRSSGRPSLFSGPRAVAYT